MKRARRSNSVPCKVCDGEWSQRVFRRTRLNFDELNPSRNRHSSARLNVLQHKYLLRHFFSSAGQHQGLCRKHLKEFAAVSVRKIQELKVIARKPVDWEGPWLDPAKPRPNYPPHRITPPHIIKLLLRFLDDNSQPMTNRRGYMLDSRFSSERAVYREFFSTVLQPHHLYLCHSTFRAKWKELRQDVILYKNNRCACNKCTAWHSFVECYKNREKDEG